MRIALLLFIATVFVTGCTKDNGQTSAKLIDELLDRYPQLNEGHAGQKHTFELVRQIKDNNWKAEFELYESAYHSGIIIIRKKNLSYCVPLFGSEYSDYWSSKSKLQNSNSKGLNTTFEKELKASNKKLTLSKSHSLYFRYLFMQVLQLGEEGYPEPCPTNFEYPFQVKYSGNFIIIKTLYSRDSITLEADRVLKID